MLNTKEISAKYDRYMKRAEALRYAKVERMRKLAVLAGIDSGSCMFIHLHNCQVGRNGKCWSRVDYGVIHQMQLIADDLFKAHELVRRWEHRQWNEWRNSPEVRKQFE